MFPYRARGLPTPSAHSKNRFHPYSRIVFPAPAAVRKRESDCSFPFSLSRIYIIINVLNTAPRIAGMAVRKEATPPGTNLLPWTGVAADGKRRRCHPGSKRLKWLQPSVPGRGCRNFFIQYRWVIECSQLHRWKGWVVAILNPRPMNVEHRTPDFEFRRLQLDEVIQRERKQSSPS